MISGERLNELIEVMRHANQVNSSLKASSKAEEESNKYWVQYNEDVVLALDELANYRRTFAKIEEMLKVDPKRYITLESHGHGFASCFDDNREEMSDYDFHQADTPFAALSALADSIIREELERKGEG